MVLKLFLFSFFVVCRNLTFGLQFAEDNEFVDEDEIDDFLDLEDDDDDTSGDNGKAPDESSQKSKKKEGKISSEKFKNLQEKFRQQSEEMKTLKDSVTKQQTFIDRITGSDKDVEKLKKEADERKAWEDDTPNKVLQMTDETREIAKNEVEKLRREVNLKRVYNEIQREYNVSLSKVENKILPIIDGFSEDFRIKNPKKAIEQALKIIGVKKRDTDLPYVESGGSYRVTGKQAKTEADVIRKRFSDMGKRKKENVFGI